MLHSSRNRDNNDEYEKGNRGRDKWAQMISLALASRIEMPLSKPNPFVPASAISTQAAYISSSDSSNHLPPIVKGTGLTLKQTGGGGGDNAVPSIGYQKLPWKADSLSLGLSSCVSHNSSHNSPSQQTSQSSSPVVKNGRSDGNSSSERARGGGDGSSGGGGGVGSGGGGGGGGGGGSGGGGVVSISKPKTMTVTPEIVMKLYMNKLTPYEHHEIFNYQQIYFIGANAKKRPGIIGRPNNNEYDNEQGSYIHVPHDHVAYRYEVLRVIGKGSFGQVVKAYDHKTHEHVALKMVRNEKRFHRQAHEEIRILRKLREQDKDNTMNIIHMFDSFTFRCHMCITFELLSINLYELIKKNNFKGFSLQLVRKFSHSLLLCLDALYKNKIIHCDMKPENVLLKQQGRSGIKCKSDALADAGCDAVMKIGHNYNSHSLNEASCRKRIPLSIERLNHALPPDMNEKRYARGSEYLERFLEKGLKDYKFWGLAFNIHRLEPIEVKPKTLAISDFRYSSVRIISFLLGGNFSVPKLLELELPTTAHSQFRLRLNCRKPLQINAYVEARSALLGSVKYSTLTPTGGNANDDVPASKTREQRDRILAEVYAGYSSTYVNPSNWGNLSGHHSLNSVAGGRSSSKTNSLQSVSTAGDIISASKTGQQRDRLDDLSMVNPFLGYPCMSESHLHGNHRSNQSSSHQSLNSVDGATSVKQRVSRQVHQAQQQQQQHNNNGSHGSSHDNYSSHGSSGSSNRLHPTVQEILNDLRR
ncbi:Putative dual specificity tyrosine-phosphorylation-regulated kinase 3-like protein [Harpegnathos saltator]|uniref:dual-specificity kinase n=1 Tax=Harpegnathos saltator TaxID=610380 RepID=E2BBP0_HARSA|nr:Putative dual specificity tyrosine-phosphorylation-regulated kinase 3-like protein [Harpegnathos saltator]